MQHGMMFMQLSQMLNIQNLFNNTAMTKQAQNSLNLYRGQNPATIKQALRMQKSSIVEELKAHFGVSDIDSLATRLSIG